MTTRRTYWHLEKHRRVPGAYQIASSMLLYYPERGFAVSTPVAAWHQRYLQGSRLCWSGADDFRDPLETTYALYVARQARREAFVDGVFRSIRGSGYDRRLDAEWVGFLSRTLPVLRFPCHGLQMLAAYSGQLVPAGRVAILALFQAADEMRRIQRFAYRMRMLKETYPKFGDDSKQAWLRAPQWQPLRKLIEHLLVTYDFAEAFVALNVLLKPAFDTIFLGGLARASDESGDTALSKLLFSLGEDAAWHREWSASFLDHASAGADESMGAVGEWCDRWKAPVAEAFAQLPHIDGAPPEFSSSVSRALGDIERAALLRRGIEEPAS